MTYSDDGLSYVFDQYSDNDVRFVARLMQNSAEYRPDGDGYVPLIGIDYSRLYGGTTFLNEEYIPPRVLTAWEEFSNRYGVNNDVFARWARTFYGVNATVTRYMNRYIIAWPSAKWCDMVGVPHDYTPDDTDTNDFKHWLLGNVWRVGREVSKTYVNVNDPEDSFTQWDHDEFTDVIYAEFPDKISDPSYYIHTD